MGKSLTPPPQAAHAATQHTALQLGRLPVYRGSWVGPSHPALHAHTGRTLGTEAPSQRSLKSGNGGGVLATPEGCLDLGGRCPLDKDTEPLGQWLLEHFGQPVPLSPETSN